MSESMGLEEEWLSTILGESTKSAYMKGIKYFLEFTGCKRVEDLRTLEKPEVKIVQFYQWLQKHPHKVGDKEKVLNANSARARCTAVQSIYSFMGLKLNVRHKLPEMTPKVEKWRPSIENLQKIYASNGLEVKAWMSLSRDVPARIGDMMTITNEQIQSGEFDLMSKKEKILGRCYVSPQTQELFNQVIKSGLKLPNTARGIGIMMQQASKICGFPNLHQHLWRKIFASKSLDLGLSETAWKFLLFKKVHGSDRAYLMNSSKLREQWQKVVDALPLEPKNGNGRVSKMEELVQALEKENAQLKLRIELLQKNFDGLKKMVENLTEIVEGKKKETVRFD